MCYRIDWGFLKLLQLAVLTLCLLLSVKLLRLTIELYQENCENYLPLITTAYNPHMKSEYDGINFAISITVIPTGTKTKEAE